MDIQVASNFERLLFDMCERDGAAVAAKMAGFKATRELHVDAAQLAKTARLFAARRVDEQETASIMQHWSEHAAMIIDPHSAVGIGAAQALAGGGHPVISLATAHPAKFPDAVQASTGHTPNLPARMGNLLDLHEKLQKCSQ